MPDRTPAPVPPAAPREVVLPRQAISAIEAAARECYRRWESTPNRDAYVWVEMERAARAAVHAVAADLVAAGRKQAAADIQRRIAGLPFNAARHYMEGLVDAADIADPEGNDHAG